MIDNHISSSLHNVLGNDSSPSNTKLPPSRSPRPPVLPPPLQVFEIGCYQESLAAYFALGRHEHINQVVEILLGEQRAYVFFERSHGDMHSFVRTCKKLREDEAAKLFRQIASAVAHCHDNGVVLRDLKLRKFVFRNEDR